MDKLLYGIGGVSFIISLVSVIVAIAALICFFILCWNIAAIKSDIHYIHLMKKYEMIEHGHIDAGSNRFIKWGFDENDRAVNRSSSNKTSEETAVSDNRELWTCPKCGNKNHPAWGKCDKCGFDRE